MVIAIIQARMGSTRLPGKVMMDLNGKPVIKHVYDRVSRSKRIDRICIATSTDDSDDPLYDYCVENSIDCFRGDVDNVLERYFKAVEYMDGKDGDYIVRITGDCPLFDPYVCDKVIDLAVSTGADYTSNTFKLSYPDGLDCEVMKYSALKRAYDQAELNYEKEHVTQYIIKHPELFVIENHASETDYSEERWTLDEPSDWEFIKSIVNGIEKEQFFMEDILDFLRENPHLRNINNDINRNEGLEKSKKEEGQ